MATNGQPETDPTAKAASADRPSYSADGVDLTLIRWMLSLTPEERLEVLRQHSQTIAILRDANPHL